MPPLLDGRTNACFGVRAFDGYTSHSFLFVLGNKGVTLACNVLFNVYLHDIMTCHKMIRTDVFRSLPLRSRGVRDRARDHRAPGAARRADLRGAGALPRARHRGGQEADRARRLPRARRRCCAAGSRIQSGGERLSASHPPPLAGARAGVRSVRVGGLASLAAALSPFIVSRCRVRALAALSAAVLPTVPAMTPGRGSPGAARSSTRTSSFAISGGPSWKPLPVVLHDRVRAVRQRRGADAVGDHRARRRAARPRGRVSTRQPGCVGRRPRWAASRPALLAAGGVVVTQEWFYYMFRGTSEPMLIACRAVGDRSSSWSGVTAGRSSLGVALALDPPGGLAAGHRVRGCGCGSAAAAAGAARARVCSRSRSSGSSRRGSARGSRSSPPATPRSTTAHLGKYPFFTVLGRGVDIQTVPVLVFGVVAVALAWFRQRRATG